MASFIWYFIAAAFQITRLVKCDFLIDQRLKEEIRQRPPQSPFFNTLYDKSFYYGGPQRPVYNVIFILFNISHFLSSSVCRVILIFFRKGGRQHCLRSNQRHNIPSGNRIQLSLLLLHFSILGHTVRNAASWRKPISSNLTIF